MADQPSNQMAQWLSERINALLSTSLNPQEQNDIYRLQQKCDEVKAFNNKKRIHFLNKTEIPEKKLTINIINDLEDILIKALNNWRKSAKFLGGKKSLDNLINHITINQNYPFLQMISSILNDLYEQFANTNENLFKHKDKLAPFIQKLQETTQAIKTTTRPRI